MGNTTFERGDTSVTIPKGKLYFKKDGTEGYEDFLEVNNFKYNIATELLELNSSRYGVVTPLTPITKSIKITGSLTCISPLQELRRFFDLAQSVDDASQASGSLIEQSFVARLGKVIELGYEDLDSLIVRKATGTTFTADDTTDVITATAHGLSDGQAVVLKTTTTLPAGLATSTIYYVRDSTTNTLKLAATSGGAAIDITSTGTGTHTLYRSYIENTDYELHPGGMLFSISGGGITDGQTLVISGTYPAKTMTQSDIATVTDFKGLLNFIGDAQVGVTEKFKAYAKLYPSGDMNMISEDPKSFEIQFTIIKNPAVSGIPAPGLARITDRSGKSRLVA